MTSTDNEKNIDAEVQPQETKEETKASPQQGDQQNSVGDEPWEIQISASRPPRALNKKELVWLKKHITHEANIRQVGSEEWVPIKDYLFPKNTGVSLDSVLQGLKTPIEDLQAEVRRLAEEMEYTKTFTTNQKTHIDDLYNENREYKTDIIEKFKTQLATAIIEELDAVDNKIASYQEEKISQEDFIQFCCELADDFREVMQKRLDIAYFKPEPGENIDLKRHKVLCTHSTDDPIRHKKISAVVRYGYGYENEEGNIEKVIRPAWVESFEYIVPSTSTEQADESKSEQLTDTPSSEI